MSKLLVEHFYYCSESNYYSNDARMVFETVDEFIAEFDDCITDGGFICMNLIFRFDVKEYDPDDWEPDDKDKRTGMYCEIFMIQQRKGIFRPIEIKTYKKSDDKKLIPILKKHWKHLKDIWKPISNNPNHPKTGD